MSSAGRSGLLGLGLGVTLSTGFIAFLIIREMLRRRNQRLLLETGGPGQLVVDGRLPLTQRGRDQALLASALHGLTPEQHTELRNTLDEVMVSVSSLRNEVAELRSGLRDIASTIVEDVRKGVEEGQRSRRRRHYLPRERSDSMSSSSIYFTASAGTASMYDDSEGGYSTAYSNVESDYTDRETDKEENGEADDDDDKDSEDDEERSCATVLTLRQDDSQAEEEEEGEDDSGAMVAAVTEEPGPELALLLTHSDLLHAGDSGKKAEGFHLLRENKPLYGDSVEFLWRLARAYNDMCELAEDQDERRSYAEQGRDEAEAALQRNGLNAECHKWFAVLTGQSSQYESMHGKLKSSHILKPRSSSAKARLVCVWGTCRGVLCRVVPCCAVPFRAVSCRSVSCHSVPCRAVLCHSVPCHSVPCRVVPCRAVPFRAVPCHSVPCRAVPCRAVPCRAVLCRAEHLDRALTLRDDDPLCFYLLGRWCFEVSRLSWVEQKAAAALFDTPPNSCLNDALENFLKCHKELGNRSEARNWAQLALSMPSTTTSQDTGISGLEVELQALIDSTADS
ncbi:hypothetical protein NFI96_026019 [Prochilodus magdalenae]|nr:hypothetical protein NFI96_026019 [Prochilodus magdalenae]